MSKQVLGSHPCYGEALPSWPRSFVHWYLLFFLFLCKPKITTVSLGGPKTNLGLPPLQATLGNKDGQVEEGPRAQLLQYTKAS